MIGEPKPQASSDTSDKDKYVANDARLGEIKGKISGDLSDEELDTLVAERKGLNAAQAENIGRAADEAIVENTERDAEVARQKAEAQKAVEDAARAEQAAAHEAIAVEDAAKAAELLEKIKSGNIGGEIQPAEAVQEESTQDIVEKIGAPKTEMFEKYGEKMRLDSSRAAEIAREMRKNDAIKNNQDLNYEERLKAEKASFALNDKRNQLLDGTFFGTTDTRAFRQALGLRNQKTGEAYIEYFDYLSKVLDEYYDTAMQDPITVMNLVEAGAINGDSIKRIDEKLRSNPDFMRKLLEVLP
jgi:hypothetical protein